MTEEMNKQMDKCSKCCKFQYARLDKNAQRMILTIQCFNAEGECKDKKVFYGRSIESRPKGKWIKNEYDWYYHCSVCKENNLLHTDETNALSDYCPNCGTDMRGGE